MLMERPCHDKYPELDWPPLYYLGGYLFSSIFRQYRHGKADPDWRLAVPLYNTPRAILRRIFFMWHSSSLLSGFLYLFHIASFGYWIVDIGRDGWLICASLFLFLFPYDHQSCCIAREILVWNNWHWIGATRRYLAKQKCIISPLLH